VVKNWLCSVLFWKKDNSTAPSYVHHHHTHADLKPVYKTIIIGTNYTHSSSNKVTRDQKWVKLMYALYTELWVAEWFHLDKIWAKTLLKLETYYLVYPNIFRICQKSFKRDEFQIEKFVSVFIFRRSRAGKEEVYFWIHWNWICFFNTHVLSCTNVLLRQRQSGLLLRDCYWVHFSLSVVLVSGNLLRFNLKTSKQL